VSAQWADVWLGLDVGSDVALANAVGREIIAAGGRKGEIYAKLRDLRDKYADDIRAGFKSAEELEAIYGGKGISPDKEVFAYCRIGERSAHTWFVLTQLLGYPNVRNYDGSWTEWGNLVGAPIKQGEDA